MNNDGYDDESSEKRTKKKKKTNCNDVNIQPVVAEWYNIITITGRRAIKVERRRTRVYV